MAATWPFDTDADEHDPLTASRIAVTGSHPMWCYLVAFDRESAARPTDSEAAMLASYLEECKERWYGKEGGYRTKLAQRPLDVDGGANGVIFRKYGPNDWGYRRQSWTMGPLYVPQSPRLRELYPNDSPIGPYTLVEVMDHAHTIVDEVHRPWLDWKAQHPEVFPA
ncbi:hypothetical protein [Streptomyces sp. NPDC059916]|uniref:hypothetical protein n=1 Tax=Streptomyces sp. NPDC059916 TaxID=3347001 RepID=UPI0036B29951